MLKSDGSYQLGLNGEKREEVVDFHAATEYTESSGFEEKRYP